MTAYIFQFLEQIILLLDNNVLALLSNEGSVIGSDGNSVIGIDMSIESLRSKGFSEYIFWFLIMSLILFCYIIYLYLPEKLNQLKTGEKIMIGAIVMGVFIAIVIGYIQLIEGYLL